MVSVNLIKLKEKILVKIISQMNMNLAIGLNQGDMGKYIWVI
jgi:hypothetical protein